MLIGREKELEVLKSTMKDDYSYITLGVFTFIDVFHSNIIVKMSDVFLEGSHIEEKRLVLHENKDISYVFTAIS